MWNCFNLGGGIFAGIRNFPALWGLNFLGEEYDVTRKDNSTSFNCTTMIHVHFVIDINHNKISNKWGF